MSTVGELLLNLRGAKSAAEIAVVQKITSIIDVSPKTFRRTLQPDARQPLA
jgi:hypothetical protein